MHAASFLTTDILLLVLAPSAASLLLWLVYVLHSRRKRSKEQRDHLSD